MRFVYPAVMILFAIVAFPLSTYIVSHIAFRAYVRELRLKASEPHVEAAYASIRDSVLATTCLLPPFSLVSAMCPMGISDRVEYSFDDLALAQRVLYAEVSSHSPAANISAMFLAIADTADLALAFDDAILLAEDGWRSVQGIGDISLLVEIGKVSRAASMNIYKLLLHAELSIARLAFVQRITAARMAMLAQIDTRLCRLSGFSVMTLQRTISVSKEATSDSVQRLRSEVQRTISVALKLLELLDRFVEGGRLQVQCAKLRRVDLCSRLDPLIHAAPTLAPVISELFTLKDVLEEGLDGYALGEGGGTGKKRVYAIQYVAMVAITHLSALEGNLLEVSTARKSVAAMLGLGRYME